MTPLQRAKWVLDVCGAELRTLDVWKQANLEAAIEAMIIEAVKDATKDFNEPGPQKPSQKDLRFRIPMRKK